MKTIALIVEYNPLHLGHVYQLQEARKRLGADCAVMVAMSGCFTQRGEPALADKWSRTRMALDAGVDLVLELPFAYACGSAERFGSGGVQLLQATGLDCHLVFGSESGDLDALAGLADQLMPESDEYRSLLRAFLDQGLSFPAARQQALALFTGNPGQAALLESANNILAVEYLKALRQIPGCRLTPMTIRRAGQAYNDARLPDQPQMLPSATAIRRSVMQAFRPDGRADLAGLLADLRPCLPPAALAELLVCASSGPGPLFPEHFAVPVLAALRGCRETDIDQIAGMGEGLGRRLITAAARPSNPASADRLAVLLEDSDTRRFTRTRIQRALIALLAGLRQDDLDRFDLAGGPQYLRILGFGKRGRYLLKIMRRLAAVPVITKASDFLEFGGVGALRRMADLDLTATDLWMLAAGRSCGRDFDTPVVMR